MTERAKDFMEKIWKSRDSGADTEEKLVAQILQLMLQYVSVYETQNKMTVLSVDDVIKLSKEVEVLK